MCDVPRIIAFTKDWNDVPTCTTHILREMGKTLPVLWISSIGTRKPSLGSGRDLGRVFARLKRLFAQAEWKENNLRVLAPLLMPKAESRLMRWLNRKLFAWYVRRERDWMGDGPIEYWCFVPNAVDVIHHEKGSHRGTESTEGADANPEPGTRNPEPALIYYCVDDWSEFEHLDTRWMAEKERKLLSAADVVFATSKYLVEKCAKSAQIPVHYLPHGVEYAKFAAALDAVVRGSWNVGGRSCLEPPVPGADAKPEPGTQPQELGGQALSTKHQITTIGFYGNICPWIDFRLIAELAKARPDWRFAMIGPVNADIAALQALPNIEFPGRVEHDDLPRRCGRFDAAIIPYDVNHPRMKSVNPVKARELLSAGVPIVASRLPDLEGMAPDILLADTADQWLKALEKQISRTDRAAISAKMATQTWDAKVAEMRNIVKSAALCRGGD